LVIIGGGLAGLAALPKRSGSWSGAGQDGDGGDVITDDAYFYGQSPPVYPSRESFLFFGGGGIFVVEGG
jgi:beta-glucosidase